MVAMLVIGLYLGVGMACAYDLVKDSGIRTRDDWLMAAMGFMQTTLLWPLLLLE